MTDNRFTQSAQVALMQAFSAAKKLGHGVLGSEHILLGLFQEHSGQAHRALRELGLTEEALTAQVLRRPLGRSGAGDKVALSDEAGALIERAGAEATTAQAMGIATEHLLLAIMADPRCGAAMVLSACGVDMGSVRRRLSVQSAPPTQQNLSGPPPRQAAYGRRELKLTLQFGTDMTQKAALGGYDPVTGRELETERLVQVLARRQKSNPVLLGDAGVGKTAIVESLAGRLALGTVPAILRDRRIISLDLAGMISGTKYRGEFEERTRQVLEEVRAAGNVILFIDEMHMIAGAGAAEGAIDAANIMKPALSRGHVQVIGATTPAEYKKYIRRDSALARRFQPVAVEEPDRARAEDILHALRPQYEAHHGVKITDDALTAAIALSQRYITDRRLPDKAIDLMDEAAALAVLRRRPLAGEGEVREALSRAIGVAAGQLEGDERRRLLDLPDVLRGSVLGQDEAVEAVARAVRRTRAFGGAGRPCSFLFCGPSGVGKTQLARALSGALFGDTGRMVRLDMSEFMEKHSVARLIGSPPGYVGYGEGGQLTEGIRRAPYSVVLLDEVEKAHPDVLNILLQVLEDGQLTDGEGETVSFGSAVLIMTSNVGLERLAGARRTGFGPVRESDLKADILSAVKKSFRPELLNRIDHVAVFRPLENGHLRHIAQRELEQLARRLAAQGVSLTWEAEVLDSLAEAADDPGLGARPIRRAVSAQVEDPVAQLWLEGAGHTFRLYHREGGLAVDPLEREGILH